MINNIQQFFYMNGHGVYVFSAYGCVLLFLMAQWFFPWRQWRRFLLKQSHHE